MAKLIKKISYLLEGNPSETPLKQRLFNAFCFIVMTIFLIFSITYIFVEGFPIWGRVALFISSGVYGYMFYLSRFKKVFNSLVWLFIFYTVCMGVFLWFSTDSWRGAMPVACILGAHIFMSIVKRRSVYKITLMFLMLSVLVGGLEYYYPSLVKPYENELVYLIDVWVTILACIIATGVLIHFFQKAYDDEQQKLQEKNNQLEKAREEVESQKEALMGLNEKLTKAFRDLKNTQSQLVQSEKLASLGQLTAGIAHEINNPINFIHAGVQVLDASLEELIDLTGTDQAEVVEIEEEIVRVLKDIQTGTDRIVDVVKGLQFFSHSNYQTPEDVDIQQVIIASLVILKHKIGNEIRIVKELNAPCHIVKGFSGQLSQVFINLVANAIDAISQQGTITIRTACKDDYLLIDVIDSGTGVPEELLNDIFDPFFTTKPVGKGTGLGLSISYGIIEKHQGFLTVANNEDKGATFTIGLPSQTIQS